jgi:hypothetical protein
LTIGSDDTGLWFEATLPSNVSGFDIVNGLRRYGPLAVSFTMEDVSARWETSNGERIQIVEDARVTSISIMDRGKACYPDTRVWLQGDSTLHDPQARTLQRHFANRHRLPPQAAARPEGTGGHCRRGKPIDMTPFLAAMARIGR